MKLPVQPPIKPMLAKLSRDLPEGDGLFYEPKWDGFRCIVFRDGDQMTLGSRNEKPMDRYFPELCDSLKANLPDRCVVDGEIVIATDRGLDFDALQMRIHPAASRVKKLAGEIPSSFVAFDLLALDDVDLRESPFAERRAQLEKIGEAFEPPIYVTPLTTDPTVAGDWFNRFEGAGLDGVVVKRKDLTWEPLRPELVCEVAYEHMQGERFRHAAHFQRWRPDRDPKSCTYDQLEAVVPSELADVFGA